MTHVSHHPGEPGLSADLKRLFSSLPRRRRLQLSGLLALQMTSALADVASLGAVVPFLAALTDVEKIMSYSWVGDIRQALGLATPGSVIILMALVFAGAILLANLFRYLTLHAQLSVTAAIGTDLGTSLFSKTLRRPYSYFLENNSSDMIANLTNDLNGAIGAVQSVLGITTQGLMMLAIAGGLLVYNPVIAFVFGTLVFAAYALLTAYIRKNLYRHGAIMSDTYRHMVKTMQEGIGGIRYVALHGLQDMFVNDYKRGDQAYRHSASVSSLLRQFPRFVLESIGILGLCGLIVVHVLFSKEPISSIMPLLGFLGLATLRLLPAVQQFYAAVTMLLGLKTSLRRTVQIIGMDGKQPDAQETNPPAPLRVRAIEMRGVGFAYESKDRPSGWAMKDISLTIPVPGTVAFVGQTGSGKSTAADLILGLIEPQSGEILIDGTPLSGARKAAWRNTAAHVPQHIFLLDRTIAENIAFGEKIDMDKIREAARLAHIDAFIETLPKSYDELVGERGVRLSGGQLQRIGIARALYRNPSVLIFDEATNALDNTTEGEVMKAITSLGRHMAVIVIAHRLSNITSADEIVVFEHGRIVERGSYEALLKESTIFRKLAAKMSEHATL